MTLVLLSFFACDGGTKEDADRSYCEAVCDWAVACQATEREIDQAAELDECLAATRDADPQCAEAEAGELDLATKEVVKTCVEAVDAEAEAGECAVYVGTVDEIKTGTPPSDCITMGPDAGTVFDVARSTTTETGAELCQRFTETFCHRTEECVLGDFAGEIPQEAIDALGGTPYELCVQRMDPVFTTQCTEDVLYEAEQSLEDVNVPRQAARQCVGGVAAATCEQIAAGELPYECGAAFTTEDQAIAFATVLVEIGEDYAEYVPAR